MKSYKNDKRSSICFSITDPLAFPVNCMKYVAITVLYDHGNGNKCKKMVAYQERESERDRGRERNRVEIRLVQARNCDIHYMIKCQTVTF